MFIDTHCHLSIEDYEDIDKVILENREAGIDKIIISGCSYNSIIESLELSNKYEDIYVTIGFHPDQVQNITNDDIQFLKEKIKNKKVVGIGEIGLDYHYSKDFKDKQIQLFEEQLKIAEDLNLPVVIHSRDATLDTINTLKKYKVRGVIHCFSGSLETAEIYISMGFYLGIGGVVTFKNSSLSDVIKKIGLSNVLLETDSPYLSPTPLRGTKNSSKNIPLIADYLSSILNISVDEVSKITLNNTYDLFDLKN